MRFEFADCEDRRIPALREFFRRCYSPAYRLAADQSLLRWQFGGVSRSPGRYHIKLAVRGNDVHACLGFVPVELSAAGRVYRGAWTANWMVDPDLRRLGLGPLLLKQLMSDFDAVLSVGLERDSVDLLPRMGWTDFGDLYRHVRVLRPADAARLTAAALTPDPEPVPERPAAVEAGVQRRRSIDQVGAVWDRLWGATGVGTRRTAEFLSWRYGDHPVFDYHIVASGPDRNLATGFAVYRIEPVRDLPVSVGRIVELLATPADAARLLATVIEQARAAGVAVLDFFCSSRRFDAVLSEAGFLPGRDPAARAVPLLFQPVNPDRTGIRFMAYVAKLPPGVAELDWYVTKGDGDQDRPN